MASTQAASFRTFFRSQQKTGSLKRIFVNCENTFGAFSFIRPRATQEFLPVVSCARIASDVHADVDSSDTLYMRLDFCSNLDGNISKTSRPPVDLVFVVDISGSMASCFPDDTDKRSKLNIAKAALLRITEQLTEHDRAALVSFNDRAETLVPLANMTDLHRAYLVDKTQSMATSGGTELANGLRHGFAELRRHPPAAAESRLQRVFFLTDMASTDEDELQVIDLARREASDQKGSPASQKKGAQEGSAVDEHTPLAAAGKEPLRDGPSAVGEVSTAAVDGMAAAHLTVIGVGVDLSVATVERISSIPGAKYVSIVNAAEFFATVTDDFNYDVRPLAFNVRATLSPGVTFSKVFGAAELNALPPHSSTAVISAEFPVPLAADGSTAGGLYLARLAVDPTAVEAAGGVPALHVSWRDLAGVAHATTVPLVLPPPLRLPEERVSPAADNGLCKAVVLSEYVRCLTEYVMYVPTSDEEGEPQARGGHDSDSDDDWAGMHRQAPPPTALTCSAGTFALLRALPLAGPNGVPRPVWPADVPAAIRVRYGHLRCFLQLRAYLLEVMAACHDDSLATTNQNILQTIDQVITLESTAVQKLLARLCPEASLAGAAAAAAPVDASSAAAVKGDMPRSFLCPITLAVMRDPVIASDGHSYENTAITRWLQGNRTSPVTNLILEHLSLVPNHALRTAIAEHLEKQQRAALAIGVEGMVAPDTSAPAPVTVDQSASALVDQSAPAPVDQSAPGPANLSS